MTITIAELLSAMLARWRMVVIIVSACVAVASVLGFVLPPEYRSESILVPATDNTGAEGQMSFAGGLGGLAALAGVSLAPGRQSAESLAMLKSRTVLERLIADQNLLPILFAAKWDAERHQWRSSTDAPTTADAVKLMRSRVLQIREDAKSGLITVQVDWRDRFAAAVWANRLVELANEEVRNRTIRDSDASLAVLTKQFQLADNVDLRAALSRLMESQIRTRTLAQVRRDYAFSVIDQAVPSDIDKRIRPARKLMVLFSAALGFLISALVAVTLPRRSAGQA